MKKVIIVISSLLFIGGVFYLNKRFGLLSLAGLNGKGLPIKKVTGNLENTVADSTFSIDHSQWSALLQKSVSNEGLVDYESFLSDKEELDNYLKALSTQVPTNEWPIQELLAYYINLYNAETVALILKNYPLKSIKDINGPWTTDFIKIGDKELSLGALEHSVLRKMNEPRIHFAINCASASCPILSNNAYIAKTLDTQLNEAAYGFIHSDKNTIAYDKLELSSLFKWFKGDFSDGDLIKFLNIFTKNKISPDAEIDYKSYDWSLNKAD